MNTPYTLDPCLTAQAMSDAFKLRYIAYRNVNAIEANARAEFRDKYDSLQNSRTCLVYEQGKPVASVRACIYNRGLDGLEIPSFEIYRSEIEKELGLDKRIIETNRFVIHPTKVDSRHLFKVPFRFILLNVLAAGGDYCINAVRPRHAPLYKRFFNMEIISAPKKYPGLNVEMVLMAGDCAAEVPGLMEQNDMFRFSEEEVGRYRVLLTNSCLQPA